MAKIDRAAKVQLLADFDAQYAAFVTAGMDEAGRGPLVGNVVAACVVMPKEPLILWVDDSKKLSEKRRESVYAEIMERALYVGIGQATPEEIDRMNILEATKKAIREAMDQLPNMMPSMEEMMQASAEMMKNPEIMNNVMKNFNMEDASKMLSQMFGGQTAADDEESGEDSEDEFELIDDDDE